MYLSDRDLRWAIERGQLLVTSKTEGPMLIGPSSIDLHLDGVDEAKIWNIPKFRAENKTRGHGDEPELHVGTFDYKPFAREFLVPPKTFKPTEKPPDDELVFRRGDEVLVRPRGF